MNLLVTTLKKRAVYTSRAQYQDLMLLVTFLLLPDKARKELQDVIDEQPKTISALP